MKSRLTVIAHDVTHYYMLDALKAGSESTHLIAERHTYEINVYLEKKRTSTIVYNTLRKAFGVTGLQV